jgi:hypothetical protein
MLKITLSMVGFCVLGLGWVDIHRGFESDSAGQAPKGFTICETAGTGTPATWKVASGGASSGKNFVSMESANSGSTFNILLCDEAVPADATLSVRLRAQSGTEDQGGGLCWRVQDEKNYYVARWNPLEKNLRAYKVVDGKRSQAFGSVKPETDATCWQVMKVRMEGSHAAIFFNGVEVMSFDDESIKAGGKVGCWTKSDAATDFDDLEISARN